MGVLVCAPGCPVAHLRARDPRWPVDAPVLTGSMAVGLMPWLALFSASITGARCAAIGTLSGGNATGSSWPGGRCWTSSISSVIGGSSGGIAVLSCSVVGCDAAPAAPG